ncbi:60S ribosomal protein L27B [Mycoemilia scoparia]|uniref:60S ribosomal protein L27 n=1 Tax=Mycoemilia scoparia TaxID=417184 RepID=A0A9W8DPL3_9FUNG|nr:60S ribosomal protein L27B [Mycoemilia scoparia]
MPKFLKPGKVVIVLQGRYAGKKAVIVKNVDEGTKERPYGHALVVGIERYPLKVTKRMGKARVEKRSRVKSFVRVINYNHLMPTRYGIELDNIKETVGTKLSDVPSERKTLNQELKKTLKQRYLSGKNKWFFTKLRF